MTSMECPHDLDAKYLYPSDADVLAIDESDGSIRITLALPCPDCGAGLSVDARVEDVEEGDFELPLDEERYD